MVWRDMARHSLVWCGVVLYGVVWRDMAWHGIVWCDVVWCGVA